MKNQILPDLTSQNQHFSEKSADLAPLENCSTRRIFESGELTVCHVPVSRKTVLGVA
jgi:hypothetical protein